MELYLDNAATTYLDDKCKEKYIELINNYYASTGSIHKLGQEVLNIENEAKFKMASLLNVKPNEIFFNSGATEGNNFAIKGVAFNYKNRGKTIITSKIEHPSVLESFKQLEEDFGFKCIYLDVNEAGVVDINQLKQVINDDTILVSIMYVNHEVGSINPIKEISSLLKKYPKVIFHSDITQAIGKYDIDLNLLDIATMSFHKVHGLKGTGLMYKKEKVTLYPIISGHHAYNAMRAGTPNWQANVANYYALYNTLNKYKTNKVAMKECQRKIIDKLSKIEKVTINTNYDYSIGSIINFSLVNYNVEVMIRALSNLNIYVSSRSVCSTNVNGQRSSTLTAMNKEEKVCISSIRLSLDHPLNDDEIDYFIDSLNKVLKEVHPK